jgi:hypothetical protein
MIKLHAVLEASAAGKVTAVAASAAAVAGGGYASVERMIEEPIRPRAAHTRAAPRPAHTRQAARARTAVRATVVKTSAPAPVSVAVKPVLDEFASSRAGRRPRPAPEFRPSSPSRGIEFTATSAAAPAPRPAGTVVARTSTAAAPEFTAAGGAPEFTP